MFEPGKASAFTAGVTSDVAIAFGRSIVQRFDVDWAAAGFSAGTFDELVEVMLRTLQSLIVDPDARHAPGGPGCGGFLREWVAPVGAGPRGPCGAGLKTR